MSQKEANENQVSEYSEMQYETITLHELDLFPARGFQMVSLFKIQNAQFWDLVIWDTVEVIFKCMPVDMK